MGDMTSEGANISAGIDLSQFYQVFFEEAQEHLEGMEALLLDLDLANPDEEQLNAIFRAAHSIKGSAGTLKATRIHELAAETDQSARAGGEDSRTLAGCCHCIVILARDPDDALKVSTYLCFVTGQLMRFQPHQLALERVAFSVRQALENHVAGIVLIEHPQRACTRKWP